jgi:hypothetical protein
MRKVCRLAREVLDIAAAAAVPGVTTDYLDEIVHKACLERNVRIFFPRPLLVLMSPVIPLTSELWPLSKICLHITQRSHLPRDSRSAGLSRW